MRFGTSVSSLRAKVRRLEDELGMGQRNCVHCRLYDDSHRARGRSSEAAPEEFCRATCEYCGSEYLLDLRNYSGRRRKVIRLLSSIKTEDIFTDARAYALYLWVDPRREVLRGVEGEGAARPSRAAGRPDKRAELTARFNQIEGLRYRMLAAKYGGDPFPDLTRRAEEILRAPHEEHDPSLVPRGHQSRPEFEGLERAEREEMVRAAMESLIFGRVSPETEEVIAGLRTRLDLLLEWPRSVRRLEAEQTSRRLAEEERRREAEARRREEEETKRREREERRRREEEEREQRARLFSEVFPPGAHDEYMKTFGNRNPR